MEVQIAVSKIKKYASFSSGDTVEVVERPQGGVSVVLADGQTSGRGAKAVSNLVVRKVIGLLAEGVRDGAAARAASDSLYTEKHGKVSSTLNIVSIDLQSNTMVITRNNTAPVVIAQGTQINVLDAPCKPIGLYRGTRPEITQIVMEPELSALIFSDGLVHAGDRYGCSLNIVANFEELLEGDKRDPQFIADALLEKAMALDRNRPEDDISIVVVRVLPYVGDEVRRMTVRLPVGF